MTFSSLGLSPQLLDSITTNGFESPTEIQAQTIPLILEGKDIFAQAETGSGKTGSFAIPVLEKMIRENKEDYYIVLSPTRELAQQTFKFFVEFGEPVGIKSACVIGGESFQKQKDRLTNGARVIVGTPGRICDLIKQKVIKTKECNCVIFDEADRLFEMGFSKDNEFVLRSVLPTRQIIMVSATNNQELLRTAYKFKSNPIEIKLNADSLTVDSIDQKIAMVSDDEKMPFLVNLLRNTENSYAIVFCNTQYMTALVAEWLQHMDFKVKAISGKLPQNKRTKLLQDFRDRKITILVCTDVAARGLDIKDVNLVVNYDLPFEPANYVHRIGRTGRTGKDGLSIALCGPDDSEQFDAIKDYLDMSIPRMKLKNEDFATDLVKRPRINSKTLQPYDSDRSKNNNKNKIEDKQARQPNKEKVTRKKTDPPKERSQKKSHEKFQEKSSENSPGNSEGKQFDRFYEIQEHSENEAIEKALKYFNISEPSILRHEVTGKGKKKFFFFGPQLTTYRFKVEPVYRKTLLPFLIRLMRKMDLKIYVDVSYRAPQVSVRFSGDDAYLLKKNRFELHNAIVELAKAYMRTKISIYGNTKFVYRTETKAAEKPQKTHHLSDEQLIKMANDLKDKAKEKKGRSRSKKLNPAQRRVIHLHIEEDSQFKSLSIGKEKLKQVEVIYQGS